MKNSIYWVLVLFLACFFSCNREERPGDGSKGMLRVGIATDTTLITKASTGAKADPGNIKLRIRKINTEIVTEYDYEEGFAPIEITPGQYELTATSGNSNDGKAGFDVPYYMGKDTVVVEADKETTANLVCTLTSVKLVVKFASGISSYFGDGFKAVVRNESGSLTFEKGDEDKAGYFAPGNLSVDFIYYNKALSQWITLSQEGITEAKARYFYTIQFNMKPESGEESSEGAANVEITTSDGTKDKNVDIQVQLPVVEIKTLEPEKVGATSATLRGSYLSPSGKMPASPVFYYRIKDTQGIQDWIPTGNAAFSDGIYTTVLNNLVEGTEYEYRFMEKGTIVTFVASSHVRTLGNKAIGLHVARIYGELIQNVEDIYFEYRPVSSAQTAAWTQVPAIHYGEKLYGAILTGLNADTEYQYRFADSEEKIFKTLSTVDTQMSPWAKFAIIDFEVSPLPTVNDTVLIQYEWEGNSTIASGIRAAGNKFYTLLDNLKSNSSYDIVVEGKNLLFNTETEDLLPHGGFEEWAQYSGSYKFIWKNYPYKTWYVGTQSEADSKDAFWDSGNYGTSADMASVAGYKNPTYPETGSRPGGSGTQVACLKSQYVGLGGSLGKFAAGNIYIGKFNKVIGTSGAEINFGRKWNTRPTSLRGWYKYTAGPIDYQGDNGPQDLKGTQDACAIYIVLLHAENPVSDQLYHLMNNTDLSTFIDFSSANKDIIGYGELPADKCKGNDWDQFDIPVVYRDLSTKPTHIMVVASASKYGDYFTGSTSSILYLDDFELVYGNSPATSTNN